MNFDRRYRTTSPSACLYRRQQFPKQRPPYPHKAATSPTRINSTLAWLRM